jgi:hypothetical protein
VPVEAASLVRRSKKAARVHVLFRLPVVRVTLALLGRASYHATLATEQLFRIDRRALR